MSSHARTCPGCRSPLEESQYREVDIDVCPACRGLFFDVGELAEASGVVLPPVAPKGHSDRPCAKCAIPMQLARMGEVEIDRCMNCGGIYLDCGELKRLRDSLPAAPESKRTSSSGGAAGDLVGTGGSTILHVLVEMAVCLIP